MYTTKDYNNSISLSATQPLRIQFREFPPSELVFPTHLPAAP